MVKLKDVARYAGVSISTVSRVLNGRPYVKPALQERVLQAVAALDYRANEVARSMRLGASRSLGLIVRDMLSVNFAEICAAAEAVAEENGYDLFVCNSNRSPEKERRYIESLLDRQVDGLVMFTADDRVNNLSPAHERSTPVVLVSSGLDDNRADRIDTNDYMAARTAVQHLTDLGHTRIGFLAWSQTISSGYPRLAGYRASLLEAGLEPDPALIRFCGVDRGRSFVETGFLIDLREPPSALIISAADLVAGALDMLFERDIRIPDDLAVVAFDNVDIARFFRPQLTVLHRDVSAIGRLSTELVLQRIADPSGPAKVVTIPFEIDIGGSTTTTPVPDTHR